MYGRKLIFIFSTQELECSASHPACVGVFDPV